MKLVEGQLNMRIVTEPANKCIVAWAYGPGIKDAAISSLSLELADGVPKAYEVWKDAMIAIVEAIYVANGIEVAFIDQRKPHESN